MVVTIALCALGWAAVASVCLLVGSTGSGWPSADQFVVRRPNVLIASLVGAALAMSGVIYQAILRNPLADPYLLGVSSGAALASYLWRLPVIASLLGWTGLGIAAVSQQLFAFAGALVAVGIVFALSTRRGRLEPLTLLLVGVIVNIVNGALFLLISEWIRDTTQQATFLVGGLQTPSTTQAIIVTTVVAVGFLLLLVVGPQLNVAVLSEPEAEALGVRIHRLRWVGLVVASLVTASAVAISGPIGFIGLICPHLARLIVGSDHRRLIPLATAAGAALLALADALSRMLSQSAYAGTLLPVGILTSLLGGPFFLLLLYQARRQSALGEGVR